MDATGVRVSLLRYNISPTIYNKEKEQSQKDKSASKGTYSPVLWQVRESGGITTDSPLTPRCLRFPPSRGGSDPHVGIRTMHLRVAEFQLMSSSHA